MQFKNAAENFWRGKSKYLKSWLISHNFLNPNRRFYYFQGIKLFVDNYESIYEMILICQAFISYLYYRQNIDLSNIDVLSRDKNNKYFSIGKLIIYRN